MYLKKFLIFLTLILIVFYSSSCLYKNNEFKFVDSKYLKVALVLSGPVNDSSWNTAAYNGLKRFQDDYKVEVAVVNKVSLDDAKKIFAKLVEKKFNLIIAHGYEYGFILKKIAKQFPEIFFCVIGGEISQENNLCSFSFKDDQYGYLIGVAAGLNTATNKVGIVVGKKIPSVERTIVGMREGLKIVNPKADLIVSYTNSWDDIAKGRKAGIAQLNRGVDVITHLADTGGIGVIKAAEEADISAIGAIVDQHDLAPSTVITSGIQDASQLVYLVCEHYIEKSLEPKIYRLGLKDQVIDITSSYGNIDPTTETRINRIKSQLTDLETIKEEELAKSKKR